MLVKKKAEKSEASKKKEKKKEEVSDAEEKRNKGEDEVNCKEGSKQERLMLKEKMKKLIV